MGPIYYAINLDDNNNKNGYSNSIVKIINQICTNDQLNFISVNAQNSTQINNLNTEIKVSNSAVYIPYINRGSVYKKIYTCENKKNW